MALADIDHDGLLEIVTSNQTTVPSRPYAIAVNKNLGNRTFTKPYTALTFSMISDFAIGDLNNDQIPDLIITRPPGMIEISLGTGEFFANSLELEVGGGLQHVKLADVNGDGKLDAIVADCDSQSVGILLGQGDGTFGSLTRTLEAGCGAIAVDDLDRDGHPDIVATNEQGHRQIAAR